MDLGLRDKVAVITGGSAGIGLAVAHGLAIEQANIVICARNAAQVAGQARQLTETDGVRALGLPADVTRASDIAQLVAEVERVLGGADILINNAGAGTEETIMEAPDEKWQYYWELHVMAAVRLAREKAPIGRFASTDELADFFVFLCSPRASYCVGSTYYVDGGWLKTLT